MNGRRVLITGAFGFTGQYVISALKKVGFVPCTLKANLCDEEAVKAEVVDLKPNAAIHLAGISYVAHGNPADFYRVNLIGTLQLLRALEFVGTVNGPIVLASSANIYGNSYQEIAIKESFLPHPINDYATSKLAMEEMAALWRNRLPITVVRPFNYTGIGQAEAFLVPKIVAAFQRRKSELSLGNVDVWRDFSDVRDVARWYTEILKRNITGQTLNLCSGRLISLQEIVSICEDICNFSLAVVTKKSLQRENELIKLCGDRTRMLDLLGNAGESKYTIRDTLQWMLNNKKY